MPNVNRAYGEDNAGRNARGRDQVAPERDTSSHQPGSQRHKENNASLRESIENFVADDMGYLKLRRGLDSQDVHLTWQFANGQFHGHYVYVRVQWWQLDYGFELLIQKRDEVYEGSRVPTPDKRSRSQD